MSKTTVADDFPVIPPLESGDRLSRDEFERRYDAMPHLKKAELIEGIVYLVERVRWRGHARPHAELTCWLGNYKAQTPGVQCGSNATIHLDRENVVQPDVAVIISPGHGGRVQISKDDFVVGAPEFVAEVASSRASIEMHRKLEVYLRNQVREYVVWRVLDQQVDWFVLRNGQFESLPLGADGIHRSEVYPGLWLDAVAMLRSDVRTVLNVLQQGLASPEHAAFVEQLRQAASTQSSR